jgi:hypothetical protein
MGHAVRRAGDELQLEPMWLLPAEAREPLPERIVQMVSRWAGITIFTATLGAAAVLLIR